MSDSKMNWDVKVENAVFQYVTGPDPEMIGHMVGRNKIKCERAILPGTELCIQKIEHIRDYVPQNTPDPKRRSSRQIIMDNFDDSFELYLVRPNPDGQSRATIWYLTPHEFDLAREWELVDYGMQEDLKQIAITLDGEFKSVIVHGMQWPPFDVDRVVVPKTFVDYIVSKEKMLDRADKNRNDYNNYKK